MKELNQYLRIIVVVLVAVAASYAVVHPHVVDISSSEHGAVSDEGTVRFHSGLFLGIDPDPGYRASVYVDDELAEYDGSGTFLYRTNVFDFGTHKIHVEFTRISNLFVSHNEGGTVTPNGNVHISDTSVRIVAIPDNGYVVDDVIVNGKSIGSINVIDLVMDKPYDVVVTFRQVIDEDNSVLLSVIGGNIGLEDDFGTIIPNNNMMVPRGGAIKIIISINPGYELTSVFINGVGRGSAFELTIEDIDDDLHVEIHVRKVIEPGDSHVIDISSGEGGKTNPSGKVTVDKGEDLEISIIPDTGYEVSSIIIDGRLYDIHGNSYVLKDITKNLVVFVKFVKLPAKLVEISILSEPDKTTYVIGDVLDTTGLEVYAKYDDGTSSLISQEKLIINPTVFETAGQQKVIVTYMGLISSFEVTVKSVTEVFGVTIKSFDDMDVNKRLSDYKVEFGVFEPGMKKKVVLGIVVDGSCNAYLKFNPESYGKELTDRIIVSINGEKSGTLTEMFSSQISLGTISGSNELTIEFSFPPGDNDNEALGKSASFKLAVLADSI